MKKLFTIILIICSLAAGAQNITLTKADTAKSNTAIRLLQSQYAALPGMDTNTVAKVRNKKVVFLQDPAIPVLKKQVSGDSSSIVTMKEQTQSYQKQINEQQAVIDGLVKQVSALQAVIDKLKIALQ